MSLSSFLFLALCFGAYKLGAYNERYPGQARRRLCDGAVSVWKWINQ